MIDYGDFENHIKISYIRRIPEKCIQGFPAQAIAAKLLCGDEILDGFLTNKSEWTNAEKRTLLKLMQNYDYLVTFRKYELYHVR